MFLAVDIGNTQTTLGLIADDETLLRQWRMATSRTDTADSLHARLYGYFHMLGYKLQDINDVAIAGVVPTLTQSWIYLAKEISGATPLVIDASRDCGIEVALPDPSQVGADRIANAVAAKTSYGAPVIVVDFGTATNIDVVDANGRFRGGAIMPGLQLSAAALFERAAKLSNVPLIAPAHALGNSTETAVQSGIVIGAAVQAEGIVRRIQAELCAEWSQAHDGATMPRCTIVGTGGLSSVVAEATDIFDVVDPDITIRGIRQIWLHRAEKRANRT
ncbi:type III pantothenate kinase [Atopobium sp. oral taxon 810]|uniref:type III pantothenate kinase n=1 Tax=Atopobium sp. oral taxon 810 TaxID=712158 RepID=UPI0003978ED3|nr:type III pantothenate kinase [Atopobium sp. oral taxon 810]ERI05685.1 putative pantothenate kinase, type III [Atopobium sp. oral taxon 810 str. F0209]